MNFCRFSTRRCCIWCIMDSYCRQYLVREFSILYCQKIYFQQFRRNKILSWDSSAIRLWPIEKRMVCWVGITWMFGVLVQYCILCQVSIGGVTLHPDGDISALRRCCRSWCCHNLESGDKQTKIWCESFIPMFTPTRIRVARADDMYSYLTDL